jgi:ferritin
MPDLSKKLHKEMNKQIQEELYSAYLYYSMGAWFESQNLLGFAHWLRVQAMEEITHAHRFHNHIILDRRSDVEMLELAKPPCKWESPLAAFEDAFKHEQHITERIHHLMKIATDEGDYQTIVGLLNWFVTEQIEEEMNVDEYVQKLKMVGDSKNGLYLLDKEAAGRSFMPPPEVPY